MWPRIAYFILKNRTYLLSLIIAITLIMSYMATKVTIEYEFAQLLPDNDTTIINHKQFKKQFGEDGAVMVIGFKDTNFYTLEKFNDFILVGQKIKKINGINEVASVGNAYNLVRNDSLNKFDFLPIVKSKNKLVQSKYELDSIKQVLENLPFYKNFLHAPDSAAFLMAVTFNKEKLNSKSRFAITDSVVAIASMFGKKHNLDIHYSGLPYIRSFIANKILNEMQLFLLLAILVTAIILFVFFRSFQIVLYSMLVVIIGVVWSFACIYLFGYKITALSGLIPPLIIVIGVPNAILLLNKYHYELRKHGNKIRALHSMIKTIGISLFFANITTSIGFFVFVFTNSKILVEFGYVASCNVMLTYVLSIILIPIIFSYLPAPKLSTINRTQKTSLKRVLELIDNIAQNHRKTVYIIVIAASIISLFGVYKIKSLGYVVDDLPKKDRVYVDLSFFQNAFKGVLPFEIQIDALQPNRAMSIQTLYKINKTQKLFTQYPAFSKALSIVDGIKFSNQAFNYGNKKNYILPNAFDLAEIANFSGSGKQIQEQKQFKAFIDSNKQKTRISIQMADVGSVQLNKLLTTLKPRVDSIFNYDATTNSFITDSNKYNITFTGSCIMFLKGNDYLVKNLIESVGIAIILIGLVMLLLFFNVQMIFISLIPSLVPLLITAGIMGYLGINLKPSTILIFSIAFGIASDGTLYFLTKYRHELKNETFSISKAVSNTIHETGVSMIYTAIILAFGFAIFAASSFGGTASLGILVSTTLTVAYASNLILLPCFLHSLEKTITRKALLKEPLIDVFDEDDDIDFTHLKIDK